MKKYIILFLFFYSGLYALERESTLKMYHGIFSALSSKTMTSVYTTDKEYRNVFRTSKRIFLAKKLEKADIILITNKSTLQRIIRKIKVNQTTQNSILFVTDYHFLKYSEDIVGAFYWRKGRSQLLFVEKRLKQQGIQLSKAYQNFMIDEL
ncbi:MAG: hypothetical protein Q9M39_02620 [Sulfurovum sp.]|nr:hypothetical protein [Sulfurovum sp.]